MITAGTMSGLDLGGTFAPSPATFGPLDRWGRRVALVRRQDRPGGHGGRVTPRRPPVDRVPISVDLLAGRTPARDTLAATAAALARRQRTSTRADRRSYRGRAGAELLVVRVGALLRWAQERVADVEGRVTELGAVADLDPLTPTERRRMIDPTADLRADYFGRVLAELVARLATLDPLDVAAILRELADVLAAVAVVDLWNDPSPPVLLLASVISNTGPPRCQGCTRSVRLASPGRHRSVSPPMR